MNLPPVFLVFGCDREDRRKKMRFFVCDLLQILRIHCRGIGERKELVIFVFVPVVRQLGIKVLRKLPTDLASNI
jgi:hypothetical protein